MALEEYDGGNIIWLRIKHSGLVQESKVEREGYKKIEDTLRDGTPYKKWIKPYKAVAGFVNKIEWYDREHAGRKFRGWNIFIDADGTPCVLDIPFKSRANSRWMKIAEMIDYSKPVRFSAWHDKKENAIAFNAQQDGVSVPQKYTRENPGNLPEPIQRTSGEWDYGDQDDFLAQRITKFVIPAVEAAAFARNGSGTPKTESVSSEPSGLENHDESTEGDVMRDIKRTVKALAGTKIVDGVSESELLISYFGSDNWEEIEKLPEPLRKAMAEKLDEKIPF